MSPERSSELFDSWAADYDYYIKTSTESFPFLGYDDVLNRIVELADPKPGMKILDVGIGTGTLAQRFLDFDCEIWGIDYSSRMLEEAKKKVPDAKLLQVDIRSEWPSEIKIGFDRIVSAYTLHHLNLEGKIDAIQRMSRELLQEAGNIIVGDISFPSFMARAEARQKLESDWDDEEYYWAADAFKTMMWGQGLYVAYEQVSDYGGVYVIVPSP
ncbi:MAG: class I SAM-dependent methyltransferase [Candidatus Thorarchaeota archaeon]|nr:class I SAM-dependent methyltransferase [Candidatus Thorarchaeota archaeon]